MKLDDLIQTQDKGRIRPVIHVDTLFFRLKSCQWDQRLKLIDS